MFESNVYCRYEGPCRQGELPIDDISLESMHCPCINPNDLNLHNLSTKKHPTRKHGKTRSPNTVILSY